MKALTGFVSTIAILLASAPASAQTIPGFGTMDRFDEQSKFASSLTYVGFDDGILGGVDLSAVRLDLYGQHLLPEGYGGYIMMPFSRVSISGDLVEDNSESGVGNLELGGLYWVPGSIPVVLRGGLSLGTADAT